ncbi:MAG: EamA family transporter RarD, partial [Planctomycetota bacterium]
RSRKTLSILLLTASLVSVNWLVFIYAVAEGQLYRASLGYFVTPLVNVILGMLFLGERLRGAQWPAIALAAAGMAWLVLGAGGFPWIELSLAVSFGFYGLVRKKASVGPIVGLTVETAVLAPVGVAFLVFLGLGVGPAAGRETGFETGGPLTVTLLVLSGLSTALPLLWFAAAAKRLPLVSIGFLQFSAPTGQFLLGVLLFDEVVPDRNWLGYALIWAGVSWFAGESYLAARRRRIAIAPGPAPE